MVARSRRGTRAAGERQEETSQHVGKVNKVDGNAPGTQEATRTTRPAHTPDDQGSTRIAQADSDDVGFVEDGT